MLIKKLNSYLESVHVISEKQHGLRKERYIEMARKTLMNNVKKTLVTLRDPLYAMLVNFKAAVDSTPIEEVQFMLVKMGVPVNVLNLLVAILQENRISIDDKVAEVSLFTQTTGLTQGYNLSPLLISIFLWSLRDQIKGSRKFVEVILYVDDLVSLLYGEFEFEACSTSR